MSTPITNPAQLSGQETVVFVHIPKTAGSTLNAVIDANFNAADIIQISSPVRQSVQALRSLDPEVQRSIRAVRGHGTMGVHLFWAGPCVYITMLRDPIDRVVSQYHFIKASKSHALGMRIREHGITLEDYVSAGLNPQLENGQVRALCGQEDGADQDVPFGQCTTSMLESAINAVDTLFMVVGLQERFDDSIRCLARALGWTVPLVDAQKVTGNRPRVEELPESTRDLIQSYNRLDQQLYAHAKRRFESQMQDFFWAPQKKEAKDRE